MILVDANLLLYIKITDYPQHQTAKSWFESQVNQKRRIGLPWESLLAFLRIVTNPRVFQNPLTVEESWQQIQEWLSLQNVWIPVATKDHSTVLQKILMESQATGHLIPDAHLAALAVEHGLIVCSTDSDFSKFPGCQWRNPLLPNSR